MARTVYGSGSASINFTDVGVSSHGYTDASLSVSVDSSGTLKWKLKMTSDSNYPFVGLYLYIYNKVLYDGYYGTGDTCTVTCDSTTFPRGNTSASGSFSVGTATSIPITLKVGSGAKYDKGGSYSKSESKKITRSKTTYYTVKFNANGGKWSDGNTTKNVEVISGKTASITNPTRSNYTFTGWDKTLTNVKSDFTANAKWEINYTKCGIPTNLSITDNNDNTFTVKGIVGSNGTQNDSTGIKICGVFNSENTPTTSNYDFEFTMTGTEGTEVSHVYGPILPNSLAGEYDTTLKIIAYTAGSISGYDSDNTSVIDGNFKYYSEPGTPIILRPSIDMTHAPHNFTLKWEQPSDGINNPIEGYTVSLECISPEYEFITAVSINDSEICGYEFKSYLFEFDKQYQFRVQALGTNSNFNSESGLSAILSIIDLEPFSDLVFTPSSLDDIKFFDNGYNYTNVLHISDEVERTLLNINWNEPLGKNNIITDYVIYLTDTENNVIEFWTIPYEQWNGLNLSSKLINKNLIESLYKEYKLNVKTQSIYTDEYQNYDNRSEFVFRVYPAGGMYINTENGMKRAIGFKRLEDGSWIPLRELYYNNEDNKWVTSDIN